MVWRLTDLTGASSNPSSQTYIRDYYSTPSYSVMELWMCVCRPNCHHPKLVDQGEDNEHARGSKSGSRPRPQPCNSSSLIIHPGRQGALNPRLVSSCHPSKKWPALLRLRLPISRIFQSHAPHNGKLGVFGHLMSLNSLKRPPSPRINVASYKVTSGGCHQAPQPRIKAEEAGNTADSGQYRCLAIGHSGNANSRNE